MSVQLRVILRQHCGVTTKHLVSGQTKPYLIAGKASVYQSLGELDQADALLQKLHPTVKNDAGLVEIFHQAKLRRSYSDTIELLRSLLAQAGSLPVLTRNSYL